MRDKRLNDYILDARGDRIAALLINESKKFQGRFVVFIRVIAILFSLSFFAVHQHAGASAFLGTQDKQLHYDLQTLVEWGYLDLAVSSYPVAWKGVAISLDDVSPDGMPFRPRQAYLRLRHYLSLNRQQLNRRFLTLQGATDEVRLRSFDDGVEETGKASVSTEFYAGRWSGQVTANYAKGGESNFDNSFIAYQYGNWNLRAGSLDQWWGPAQSSSLIMSNNTRPIKALALSRSVNTATQSSWLSWMGPWYFSTQMGQLEDNRANPKTKIFMNRFNARPFKGFEFGVSWTAMWGGEGQPQSVESLIEVITLQSVCPRSVSDCSNGGKSKRGSHIAAIDFSYTTQFLNRPWTFYLQRAGENANNTEQLTDNAKLMGFSTYIDNTKVFVEYSNTILNCTDGVVGSSDCLYEDSEYTDGYRAYGRTFGSTFDSDAKQITIGANIRLRGGEMAEVYIRSAKLNEDGRRPSPVLTADSAEDLIEVSGFYQKPMGAWLIKAGGSIANRRYPTIDNEVDIVGYVKAQYAF